ncbi:MAG: hypothetical protein HYV33_03970 [Candidatus Kerfeldbacteria bacterium]|nr:hypothetical protein [Candidatus Kerfeldbacteria bacterium]
MNINKHLKNLSPYGMGKKDFEIEKNELEKKFGQQPTDQDVLYSLFNKLVVQTSDFQDLKSIYYSMALFLNEEGHDSLNANRSSAKMGLAALKNFGVKKVEILVNSGCEECQKLAGQIFDIDKAMTDLPIPNQACKYDLNNNDKPLCRCEYLPVIDD